MASSGEPLSDQSTSGGLDLEREVTILKALSHPVRLRIVDLIRRGGREICVCEIETCFDLSQPTISHHLKVLRDAGIIRSRQDGTWVRHVVDPEAFGHLGRLISRFTGEDVAT